ncbi:MAG: hypothetical protein U0935_10345 [Pirellulales bacterium]
MRARVLGFVGCLLGLIPGACLAASPRLVRLTPPGGQRGTVVEVQFVGRFLDQPQEVLCYDAGLAVESLEPLAGDIEVNGRKERVEPGTRVRVRLRIADDCPLGPKGVRLRTAGGLTDYQRFFVGPFPTVDETETSQQRNDHRDRAQPVSLPATVSGRLADPVDVDLYRIEVRQGQRISAELEAARLGVERGLPDLHLSLLDAEGRPLVAADDSSLFLQDPVISTIADHDGTCYVAVRHSIYNASNDAYRLHLGTFPRPTAIFPPGGQYGQELAVRWLGDPRGETQETVQLPAAGPAELLVLPREGDVTAPSPLLLRLSDYPNHVEAEPNDEGTESEGAAAVAAELPAALNGIINRPGDVDVWRVRARKGERFRIHVLANALGSPVDPAVTLTAVERRNGGPLRATESRPQQLGLPPVGGLQRNTLDPLLEWTVPADGEYLLRVEDERGQGGPTAVYRVEISPETDAVWTYVPQEPENQLTPQARQTIPVPAGNRYNTTLAVIPTARSLEGEWELVAEGLPPGVTMEAPRLTAAVTRVPVVFTAEPGTPLTARLIDIRARPVAGASPSTATVPSGFRQIVAMNGYGNNDFYLHTVVDRLALAVTEPAPFTLEVDEPKSALVQNGEMALRFRVLRSPGFTGPVTVTMEWRPNGVTGSTPVLVRPDQVDGEYLLSAARNAPPGTTAVTLTCVSGSERPGYNDSANRTYVAARPFALKVAEPHVEARLARTSIERGKTAQLVVKVNVLRPWNGTARATLARLPRGVRLVEEFRELTAADKEVTFTLQASDECLVGNYQGLTLDLSVVEDGQTVRQLCGSGMLRIDTQRGVATR